MASRSIQVGAFQAKTRLPELLREVERGKSFVILRRGRTVARLVPASDRPDSADFKRLLDSFRQIRRRVRGPVVVRRLIEQGRRR